MHKTVKECTENCLGPRLYGPWTLCKQAKDIVNVNVRVAGTLQMMLESQRHSWGFPSFRSLRKFFHEYGEEDDNLTLATREDKGQDWPKISH